MKKVLFILNDCMRMFTYERTSGLYRALRRMGEPVDLYIFRSDGHSDFAPEHNCGEYNIFRLPDYRDFDGIFLDINSVFKRNSDAYASEGVQYAIQAAAASGRPVISMANEIEGFTYVGIDNYSAMRSVIEYLHGSLGMTDFWFAMGPPDNQENLARTRGLTEYCRENGLPCGEDRFFAESFLVKSGIRAFAELRARHGDALPQAVICANDHLALGVCHAAQEAGLVIPRDLTVSGFDNSRFSAFYPSIVTVDQSCWRMGEVCADAMRRLWRGEALPPRIHIPTELVVRDSAGQNVGERDRDRQIWEQILHDSQDRDFGYRLNALQYQLPGCKSVEEMGSALVGCLSGLNCNGLRLVLDSELLDVGQIPSADGQTETSLPLADRLPTQGYTDRLEIAFSWDAETGAQITRRKVGCHVSPAQGDGCGENDLFVPLHFMERAVGYLAIRDCLELIRIKGVSSVVNTLTMALRSYFSERRLSYMNSLLSGISKKDELTGLYNRLGYHDLAYPLFREICGGGGSLGILFMDMDRLKHINDTYGHVMGDLAIRSAAGAILRSVPADALPIRYGGDEFLVLIPNADAARVTQIMEAVKAALPDEARALGAPDMLDVSAGFTISAPDGQKSLDQYVQEADGIMYRAKKAKKQARAEC